jgi:hypothetical protein
MTFVDLIEVAGSLLVLSAFAAAQKRLLGIQSVTYLGLNIVGSAVLAVIALMHQSWGFLLLEGTWAVVSTIYVATALRHRGGSSGRRGRVQGDPSDGVAAR